MIKNIKVGASIRTFHCYTECPDVAGTELKTVINSALNQLNKLLDDTYSVFKTRYLSVTCPMLYVYICEQKIDEINAFTDGTDIFLSAASMIGMHDYIEERLNTEKANGEKLVPEGLEVTSSVRIYKNILEIIVAHELTHIWHGHRPWKKAVLRAGASSTVTYDDILSEQITIDDTCNDRSDEEIAKDIYNLQSRNGILIVENQTDLNYIQQILEMDADCGAMSIVLSQLQREINEVMRKNLVGTLEEDKREIRSIISYHSYLLGLLVGASGLMCGYFDNQREGKPFDRLGDLLRSSHPIPAVRFYKMHATLLSTIHEFYTEEKVANILLSQIDAFAIDIFAHDDEGKDIRNCFWVPVQTKEAQEFIVCLERGWNMIRDSLQQYALLTIPNKYTEDDLQIDDASCWYDRHGNLIIS